MTEQERMSQIQHELIEAVIPGGMMGGYDEEGFPFYYINQKMLDYLGYPDQTAFVKDIDGKISNCMHPEDRERVDAGCAEQLARTGSYELEYRMRCMDGSYIWVHDIGKRFQTENGRTAIISVCYDITAEKDQNQILQKFADSMNGSMGVYKVSPEGRLTLVYVSSTMGNMIGMSKEDYKRLCEVDAMECIYPADREKVQQSILETVRTNKATSISFRSLNRDGSYTWLNGSYSRSGEMDGEPVIRVIFTPVTDQFELQQDVLSHVPGGICLYKWDGVSLCPLVISSQFARLHGGEAGEESERISAVNFEYVHADDLAGYKDFIAQIIAEPGKERTHTFRFWHLTEKRYVWIGVTTTDILQADGTLLIYASYTNVDFIKEAEEKLKENEKLLEARIHMEQERLLGGDGVLLAYVVTNVTSDCTVEHKTFLDEVPISSMGKPLEAGARLAAATITDAGQRETFLRCHEREYLHDTYESGQSSITLEYRRKKFNGLVIWERNVLNLLREPTSGDLFLYEYCYDISKEKILEETMVAAVNYDYERFGSINLLEDQISMLIPDPGTGDCKLKVQTYSDLCRIYAKRHVIPEDQEMFLNNVLPESLKTRLREHDSFEFIHRENGPDGALKYKQDRHACYDRERGICLLTRSDITDMVYKEEEKQKRLQRALEKEQIAARAKSDFLSRMSHELRTPLNAISGYTDLLLDAANLDPNASAESRDQVRQLRAIKDSTRYLLSIIGDLLDRKKIENGKVELVKERVNAHDYMKQLVDMIRPEARRKQLHFSYRRLTRFSEYYYVDGVHLQQILLNILHNAVKFTPEGGTVRMTAESLEEQGRQVPLRFTITDTGIGMSEEFVEQKLYQPFTQENQGIKSPYEGTGIGMSISKELIKLMGGDIICQSRKGEGTTFTVTILADAAEAPGELEVEDTSENRAFENGDSENRNSENGSSENGPSEFGRSGRRQLAGRQSQSYDLKGRRILLCEDNPMNQDMTRRLLTRMNGQVEVADDGKLGLERFVAAEPGHFDLILMDLRMPEMDGFEAARAIRALDRPDADRIPILALSANAFAEDVRMTIEAGMNEHLAKPAGAKLLYEKITQYCG